MANYKVVYTMIDGITVTNEIFNRNESLKEMVEVLIGSNFATHITPDGKVANVINNRNVLHMEVSEL